MITLLVSPERFDARSVEITGEDYRHLFRARRVEVGESLRLVDGEGRARSAVVDSVGRDRARAANGEVLETAAAESREIEIWVASPRPERAAWLVEKCAELGARRIVFVESERAPRQTGAGRVERLQRIADGALEQSHGLRRTRVEAGAQFHDLLAAAPEMPSLLLHRGGASLASIAGSLVSASHLRLALGPEGGFSPEEVETLIGATWTPVSLGRRVLRIETAAVLAAGWFLLAPVVPGPSVSPVSR